MTLKEFKQIEDLFSDDCQIFIVRDKKKEPNPIGFQVPEGKEVVPVQVNDTGGV